jgi:L-glyceraldehyde 3-phosphate reductase
LADIAANRSQTLAQMAIAWILRLEEVTSVLCGASRPEQIVENCQALQTTDFSADEISSIDALLGQVELPSSLWAREN